jgi:hypothetical protein
MSYVTINYFCKHIYFSLTQIGSRPCVVCSVRLLGEIWCQVPDDGEIIAPKH